MISDLINEINMERFYSYLIGFTRDIFQSFKLVIRKNFIPFHLTMILITIPLVALNIDWNYFIFFRNYEILTIFLFPAVPIGSFVPFFLPPIFYLYGKLHNYRELEILGMVLTQTAVVGLFWSSLYKAFTGRHGPEFRDYVEGIANYSQEFYFGFLIGGVFDGWPSGHTTINVAVAICFYFFRPDQKLHLEFDNNWITKILKNRKFGLIYAFYIGFGISTNIHWFSDFVAGLILGYCVGKSCADNAQKIWMKDDKIDDQFYNNFEDRGYDSNFKLTFVIIFLTIFFSIFVPREIFNL